MADDEYQEQVDEQYDAQQDAQDENTIRANGSAMVENRLELISQIISPDKQELTYYNIRAEESNEGILAKQFLDITRDLSMAILDEDERETILEYNRLIGIQLHMQLWGIAIDDIREVRSRLGTSRSLKGENLKLLFSTINKIEKISKKETRTER
jgi:hypothetical protein